MIAEAKTGMNCGSCGGRCQSYGRHRNGLRRFRCLPCKRTYTQEHERTLGSMYIPQEKAVLALQLLLEGNSIRSTERVSGLDRNTILSLLEKSGERCAKLMQHKVEHVTVKDVELDEIWGFCQKKESQRSVYDGPLVGDAWCFIAMERSTKLVLAYHVGKRTKVSTEQFIGKPRYATSDSHYQLTTDGFPLYPEIIHRMLQDRVSYGKLIKVYSSPREGEQRYSPGDVVEAVPVPVFGRPDKRRICTSHIERHNLSIRTSMRRMTRLSLGFSKKWANLEHAYALWFAYYNFCRVHRSLRVTPAMENGITDHIWTIAELIA
jgi:transposase-like protein/IS1 family transposase